MSDLHEKNCIPCRGGIPPFDISEIHKFLKKVDGWDVKKKENEIYFLEKNFTFKNFSESQKFVNEVGNIAEWINIGIHNQSPYLFKKVHTIYLRLFMQKSTCSL